MRDLKNEGHYLIIHTGRHMRTCDGDVEKVIKKIGKVTEDWLESNATSGQGTTTSIGHHRSGTTYNASLAESYSASTYSMAWQLGMGGSGTANAGWNGWAYEITSYP